MEAFAKSMGGAANKMEQEGQQEVQLPFLNRLRSEVSDSAEFRSLRRLTLGGAASKDDRVCTLTRGGQEAVSSVRSQLLEDEVYVWLRRGPWPRREGGVAAQSARGIGGRWSVYVAAHRPRRPRRR